MRSEEVSEQVAFQERLEECEGDKLGGEHSRERELLSKDPRVARGLVLEKQERGQGPGEVVGDEAREVAGTAGWGLCPSLRTTGLSSSGQRGLGSDSGVHRVPLATDSHGAGPVEGERWAGAGYSPLEVKLGFPEVQG